MKKDRKNPRKRKNPMYLITLDEGKGDGETFFVIEAQNVADAKKKVREEWSQFRPLGRNATIKVSLFNNNPRKRNNSLLYCKLNRSQKEAIEILLSMNYPELDEFREDLSGIDLNANEFTPYTLDRLADLIEFVGERENLDRTEQLLLRKIELCLQGRGKGMTGMGANPRKRKNGRNLGYGGKNGQMLRNQLRTIERVSKQLHDTLTDSDQVPDWVLSKAVVAMDRLIVANEYIQSKLEGMTPNPRVNVNSAIKNAQKLLKDL